MRMAIAVGLFGLVSVIAGWAHGDTIGLYSDTWGTNCNISENVPLTYVYVVHTAPGGATASEFSAPKPACWTGATWMGDQERFLCLIGCGDSQTGKTIGYGSCVAGSIHILTIMYFTAGASGPCCAYPLLPHPGVAGGQVQVADCDFNVAPGVGLMGVVNGNATCPCGYPVPLEETTWGQVKALYGE